MGLVVPLAHLDKELHGLPPYPFHDASEGGVSGPDELGKRSELRNANNQLYWIQKALDALKSVEKWDRRRSLV
jgi:hypothetical protein